MTPFKCKLCKTEPSRSTHDSIWVLCHTRGCPMDQASMHVSDWNVLMDPGLGAGADDKGGAWRETMDRLDDAIKSLSTVKATYEQALAALKSPTPAAGAEAVMMVSLNKKGPLTETEQGALQDLKSAVIVNIEKTAATAKKIQQDREEASRNIQGTKYGTVPPAGAEALREAAIYFRDRCLPHPETKEWLKHNAALAAPASSETKL